VIEGISPRAAAPNGLHGVPECKLGAGALFPERPLLLLLISCSRRKEEKISSPHSFQKRQGGGGKVSRPVGAHSSARRWIVCATGRQQRSRDDGGVERSQSGRRRYRLHFSINGEIQVLQVFILKQSTQVGTPAAQPSSPNRHQHTTR